MPQHPLHAPNVGSMEPGSATKKYKYYAYTSTPGQGHIHTQSHPCIEVPPPSKTLNLHPALRANPPHHTTTPQYTHTSHSHITRPTTHSHITLTHYTLHITPTYHTHTLHTPHHTHTSHHTTHAQLTSSNIVPIQTVRWNTTSTQVVLQGKGQGRLPST